VSEAATIRESGARRVLAYNWPIYVLTWVVGPVLALVGVALRLPGA
jgi:hypothetical protein